SLILGLLHDGPDLSSLFWSESELFDRILDSWRSRLRILVSTVTALRYQDCADKQRHQDQDTASVKFHLNSHTYLLLILSTSKSRPSSSATSRRSAANWSRSERVSGRRPFAN